MTPRILWGALLASQAIYVALLSVPGLLANGATEPDPAFLMMLIGPACGAAVISFVIPAMMRRNALAVLSIETREVPDPHAVQGFRGAPPMIREYVDPLAARRHASGLAFVPFIVSLAMSEAISVFGFIVGLQGHPVEHWAPFFAVGMTLTAIRFPTEHSFYGPFEAKTGITLPR